MVLDSRTVKKPEGVFEVSLMRKRTIIGQPVFVVELRHRVFLWRWVSLNQFGFDKLADARDRFQKIVENLNRD